MNEDDLAPLDWLASGTIGNEWHQLTDTELEALFNNDDNEE